MHHVQIRAAGKTDVGRVRSSNQDAILVDQDAGLFVVADGMGGHVGGEIASSLCISEIRSFLAEQGLGDATVDKLKELGNHPEPVIVGVLARAINHASGRIYERALEEPMLKGMGTTATVVKVIGDRAYCGHVGDSRLYLIRCGLIYQMTHDHSLVSEQVRAGLLTKQEAELHHLKNVITRSVGYQEEEDVDTLHFQVEDGDLILLCSDGLHGELGDAELSRIAGERRSGAVDDLIRIANERGGDDNISVVILDIKVSH